MSRSAIFSCLLLLASCGSPPPVRPARSQPAKPTAAHHGKQALTALLPAYELARVEPGTYGPISVSLDAGTLSVWASPGPKERTWYARSIDRTGHATMPPRAIGTTGLELGLVTLSAVSQGLRSLLVYSTQPSEQSTKLQALLLDSEGTPKSKLADLVTLGSTLLWTQIVDTGPGPMVFYAIAREERAEVRVVGLTADGALRFADRLIESDLRAWQVVAAPDGAVLGVVRATRHGQGPSVSLLMLDPKGELIRDPIALDDRNTAELDLDLTRVGKNYVVAWSDRSHIDSRIQLAVVDPIGMVLVKPRPALVAVGEQTLVKLVPAAKGKRAVLVWENPTLPFPRRRLSLAEVDENGHVGQRIVHLACSSRSSTLPEIIATDEGIRALTFDDLTGTSTNEATDPTPTFVEFGPDLTPLAAVPLNLQTQKGTQTVPLLAWGLDCRHGCRATAALDDNPVSIATIALSDARERPGSRELVQQLAISDPKDFPRLEALESLAEVEPLADLAAARGQDSLLVAAVTYFDPTTPTKRLAKPGPDGRTDPLQARVEVFPLSPNGSVGQAQTISFRASSLPGLAMAKGQLDGVPSGVAWSAIDQGQPQLFLTTLGDKAKKLGQRMLTHKRGRLDEISLVAVADGWLVGWIDERTGGFELYATRLNSSLERRGNEQKLTNRPGELSALALAPLRDEVLAVYAAAQKTSHKRALDLVSRRIATADAQPIERERRILEVPGDIKFLQTANYEDGVILGWLEIPFEGGPSDHSGSLHFARIDNKGQLLSQFYLPALADTVPASLAIDCPTSLCRGVIVADVGGRGELQGFTFDPRTAGTPRLVPLARSLGTVEQNVAPVLAGEHIFMVDQIDAERARIVHAKVAWE